VHVDKINCGIKARIIFLTDQGYITAGLLLVPFCGQKAS